MRSRPSALALAIVALAAGSHVQGVVKGFIMKHLRSGEEDSRGIFRSPDISEPGHNIVCLALVGLWRVGQGKCCLEEPSSNDSASEQAARIL